VAIYACAAPSAPCAGISQCENAVSSVNWLISWLLFSARFTAMRDLFAWQLVGDVLKVGAYVYGYLHYKGRNKQYKWPYTPAPRQVRRAPE
jgi:hypothetical protein